MALAEEVSALAVPLDPDVMINLTAKLQPELQHLLEVKGLPIEVRAQVAKKKLLMMDTFASMATEEKDMRSFFSSSLGLNQNHEDHLIHVANLVAAWKSASVRSHRRRQEEAEVRVTGRASVLLDEHFIELRQAYETAHKTVLPDDETPAAGLVQLRISQIEKRQLEAETLDSLVTAKQAGNKFYDGAQHGPDGTVRIVQMPLLPKGSKPKHKEDLREKITLLGNLWEFARLKLPSNPLFEDLDEKVWVAWFNFFYTEETGKMQVKTSEGATIMSPSFWTLTEFEFQLRKAAYKKTGYPDYMTLKAALEDVKTDKNLYSRYFSIPTSTSASVVQAEAIARGAIQSGLARKQPPPVLNADDWNWSEHPAKRQKGNGEAGNAQGKGRGKNKGKTRARTTTRAGGKASRKARVPTSRPTSMPPRRGPGTSTRSRHWGPTRDRPTSCSR